MKFQLVALLIVLLSVSCSSLPREETISTPEKVSSQNERVIPMVSAPINPRSPLTRIAFGSCLDEKKDQTIWTMLQAEKPDMFLFIGDNVYGDPRKTDPDYGDPTMARMVASYNQLAGSSEFSKFRALTPILTTWDDHDYGENDAGADFKFKELSESLYLDAWNVDETDIRRTREGVYMAKTLGPENQRVQIILLDTRTFRGTLKSTDEKWAKGKERYLPNPDSSQPMLGEAQWAWLTKQLDEPAELRIIASSIQIHAEGHGWEAWRTLPHEQARFYDLLETKNIDNAFIISGDRHLGGLYYRQGVWEITSSSLNKPSSVWRAERGETGHEDGPYRIGLPQYETNYGLLDIDWTKQEVRLTLRSPGQEDQSQTIKF